MQVVTEQQAVAALGRIKQGATLSEQSRRLGLHSNQPLRRALVKLLGSREKYSALMSGGRQARSGGAGGPEAGGDDEDGLIDVEVDTGEPEDVVAQIEGTALGA